MSTKSNDTDLKLSSHHDLPDTGTSSTIGKFLQREREKRHISLKEIEDATCINIHTLMAIENDDAKKLPADVFTKGFIKLYLKQLDLDPQEILDHYMPKKNEELGSSREDKGEVGEIFSAAALAESTPFLTPKLALFLLITFLSGILIFWICRTFRSADIKSSDLEYEQVFEKHPAHDIPTPHKTNVAAMHDESENDPVAAPYSFENRTAINVDDIQIAVQETKQPTAKPEETNNNAVQPVPVRTEPLVEHFSESAPPRAPPPLSQLAGTNIPLDESPALSNVDEEKDRQQKTKYAYILKVMFTETTWMQITVDDKPPRGALYKAGSRRIWRAREKMKLHIGNTGGVNLTLNGSPVASLGPSGHSTKITIPDDLPL